MILITNGDLQADELNDTGFKNYATVMCKSVYIASFFARECHLYNFIRFISQLYSQVIPQVNFQNVKRWKFTLFANR